MEATDFHIVWFTLAITQFTLHHAVQADTFIRNHGVEETTQIILWRERKLKKSEAEIRQADDSDQNYDLHVGNVESELIMN